MHQGLGALALAFGAGIVSFLSPCVLPLIPAYISFITGIAPGELRPGARRLRDVLVPSLLFVLGFTLVFVALGASASALGGFRAPVPAGVHRGLGRPALHPGLLHAGRRAAPVALRRGAPRPGQGQAVRRRARHSSWAWPSASDGRRAWDRSSRRSWCWRPPRRTSPGARCSWASYSLGLGVPVHRGRPPVRQPQGRVRLAQPTLSRDQPGGRGASDGHGRFDRVGLLPAATAWISRGRAVASARLRCADARQRLT